jgi:hypothetical protein
MFFNGVMSIWILAILTMGGSALAGWRLGAIRSCFSLIGIFIAALLATGIGGMVKPLLPHLGVANPVLAWAIAPILGFIIAKIPFTAVSVIVHKKIEVFYKYKAGDLQLALWERLNARLGICIGLVSGLIYFVLLSFFIFNASYWTTQVTTTQDPPLVVGLVNKMGNDLESAGLTRTAAGVGMLPATYYQLADLSGLLLQNPPLAERLANYPALTSLWERDDIKALLQDSTLTNVLVSGTSASELFANPSVKTFMTTPEMNKLVLGILQTNMSDLFGTKEQPGYLFTGKSAKYDEEKIIGRWELNVHVTLAWMRQDNPRITASAMRAARVWMTQAYADTRILVTGDNQIFIKGLPQMKPATTPGQPPTTDHADWKGDWTRNGSKYDLHLTSNGQDKFMTATAEALRLTIRDGKNMLIYDRVD